MPSDMDINVFILTKCDVRQEDVLKACSMRNRQQFWLTFKTEELANDYEKKLLSGIEYGSGIIVTGSRLDMPKLHIKLRGAAPDWTLPEK